jgi:hypothetical protein
MQRLRGNNSRDRIPQNCDVASQFGLYQKRLRIVFRLDDRSGKPIAVLQCDLVRPHRQRK